MTGSLAYPIRYPGPTIIVSEVIPFLITGIQNAAFCQNTGIKLEKTHNEIRGTNNPRSPAADTEEWRSLRTALFWVITQRVVVTSYLQPVGPILMVQEFLNHEDGTDRL